MDERNTAPEGTPIDAEALRDLAEQYGVTTVMAWLGARQIRIPFRERMGRLSIDELSLSVRSNNGLMRAGITTYGALNDLLRQEGDVVQIRNLGVKSRAEVIRIFCADCYARLNAEEKLRYWQRVLELDAS